MKNKIIEFLKSKGYIFIALICLAAVVAAGVSLINMEGSEADAPVAAYKTPEGSRSDVSSATAKPSDSSDTSVSTPQSTIASKPIDDTQNGDDVSDNNTDNTNESRPKISILKPIDGNIQIDFAANKLVFNTTMQEWRTHAGVDIETSAGSEIKAAAGGKISAIKSDPRYGLTVVIEHDINNTAFTTIYCGIDKTSGSIQAGSNIKAGDVIGTVGEDIFCERAQGAHLHFELIEDNIPLDPTEYWE